MRARVKDTSLFFSVRSAGELFVKGEWSPVPAWAEAEIKANDLLEIEEIQPMPEPDQAPEPDPAPKKLTKMVVAKKKRGKTV